MCKPLSAIKNGSIRFDRPRDGKKYPASTIAYYSCKPGFILHGNGVAVCLHIGGWVLGGESPNCKRATGNRNRWEFLISANSVI